MFKIVPIIFSALLVLPVALTVRSQNVDAVLKQAEAFENALRDEDALKRYLEVIRIQPTNLTALCKASELYNIVGKRQSGKDKQRQFFRKGKEYALQALKVDPMNAEANFAMAVSMGRMALISSGEEKIKAVKDIKVYADKCIQIDPANFKGHHVLGKWHYEISNLSALERWLVKVTYGALPPSSLADAAHHYEKSLSLSPSFLLNYLELARVYREQGKKDKARGMLAQLQKLPPKTSDDPKIKQIGKELLDDL